jgi:hypothetical protein
MPTPHEEGGGSHAHVRTTRRLPCQAARSDVTPTPNRQDGVKTSAACVKEASARGPRGVPAAETRAVVSDAPEGPPMADLAYALLLVGGFALLALMLRGLDAP